MLMEVWVNIGAEILRMNMSLANTGSQLPGLHESLVLATLSCGTSTSQPSFCRLLPEAQVLVPTWVLGKRRDGGKKWVSWRLTRELTRGSKEGIGVVWEMWKMALGRQERMVRRSYFLCSRPVSRFQNTETSLCSKCSFCGSITQRTVTEECKASQIKIGTPILTFLFLLLLLCLILYSDGAITFISKCC